ncbi:MAG TPA: acyloxyacyl hydrolase [Candidatus Syntrophosphaera sp.]|nr:acyloxyacyl hydrolase [Candidatus Syntrophosphaera sp.]
MNKASVIALCVLLLIFARLTPLRAESRFIEDKVPLRVFGIVVLHGAGLGAALLLTQPDSLSRGVELGQSDVFALYETQLQLGSGRNTEDLIGVNLGLGKMLRPWLESHAKLHLLSLQDRGFVTIGGAFDLGFRLLFPQQGKWKCFYDSGVGICLTQRDFPAGGTKLNFMSSFGAGVLYRVRPGLWWQAGYRHSHISNAGWIAGDDRNPGYDANGAYTGFLLSY